MDRDPSAKLAPVGTHATASAARLRFTARPPRARCAGGLRRVSAAVAAVALTTALMQDAALAEGRAPAVAERSGVSKFFGRARRATGRLFRNTRQAIGKVAYKIGIRPRPLVKQWKANGTAFTHVTQKDWSGNVRAWGRASVGKDGRRTVLGKSENGDKLIAKRWNLKYGTQIKWAKRTSKDGTTRSLRSAIGTKGGSTIAIQSSEGWFHKLKTWVAKKTQFHHSTLQTADGKTYSDRWAHGYRGE